MTTPTIDTTERSTPADDLQGHLVADDGVSVIDSEDGSLIEEEPIAEVTCTKCETTESWNGGSWCPACGYYPLGNKYINLEVMGETASSEKDDLPENLWQAIPRWGWELFAGVMVIAGISLTVTLTQEAGSPLRSWWAVIQAVLGMILFLAVHSRVFFLATMLSERLSPISWLTEPIQIWKPIFKEPEQYQWHIRLAIWGPAAALLALLLVGGLNYSGLFKNDWGIKGVANSSLMSAINDAEKEKEAEEKIAKLTNKMNGTGSNKNASKFTADCVVMGFTRDGDGDFRELLLASTSGSQLQYVGRIPASDLTTEQQQEINALLKKTPQRKQPIVKTVHSGTWLKPQMMLKVGYDKLTETSRFKKIQFQSVLREEK